MWIITLVLLHTRVSCTYVHVAQVGVSHVSPRFGLAPPIPCFDARKDISIPTPSVHWPRVPYASPSSHAHAKPRLGADRPLLLFAVGANRYSACRQKLLHHFERRSDDGRIVVARYLPRNVTAQLLLHARFCPICSGFSPWTQRLPEVMRSPSAPSPWYFATCVPWASWSHHCMSASPPWHAHGSRPIRHGHDMVVAWYGTGCAMQVLEAGCVPIVITERWTLPFDDLLDYSAFTGQLPLTRLDELVTYAHSLDHAALQRRAMLARHTMRYDLGPRRADWRARASGEVDMLPLLVYEMWHRLQWPMPQVVIASSTRSGVRTDENYSVPNASASQPWADGYIRLNRSHAFLNETLYRCWTRGIVCSCGRASANASSASNRYWNYKRLWPPKVDIGSNDQTPGSTNVDLEREQRSWLLAHGFSTDLPQD